MRAELQLGTPGDLDALSLKTDPVTVGLWLPLGAIVEPDVDYRYTYAPTSVALPGQVLLSAVLDSSTLPTVVEVWGSSTADLMARRAALEKALGRWSYTATLLVDGVLRGQWRADLSSPHWGEVTGGRASHFMSRASVVIPIHPL